MSGVLKSDATYQNTLKNVPERVGSLSLIQGKETTPVSEVVAGDIASVAKLKESQTGSMLADKSAPIIYPKLEFPEPVISFAIEPKSRGDEEKISTAMQRMAEEDPMLRFHRESQPILSGTGCNGRGFCWNISRLSRCWQFCWRLCWPVCPCLTCFLSSRCILIL